MASQSQANVAPIPAPALEPAPRRPFSDEALLALARRSVEPDLRPDRVVQLHGIQPKV